MAVEKKRPRDGDLGIHARLESIGRGKDDRAENLRRP
jgi:hypothetical protein